MLTPITISADIPASAGNMYDLNLRLRNPHPRRDWKPGDIAWVYVRSERNIVSGPLDFVNAHSEDANLDDVWCGITALAAKNGEADIIFTTCSQLFPSLEAINAALLGAGDLAANKSDSDAPAKGFAWFDFDGTLCAPIFNDNGNTVFGFREDLWVEFCDRNGAESYIVYRKMGGK